MEFYEVLERRRTIRDFSDKIVTDEVLEKILSAAFKAPTNDHLRQFEFIVVRVPDSHRQRAGTCETARRRSRGIRIHLLPRCRLCR